MPCGEVDRSDQLLDPLRLRLQCGAVRFKRGQDVKVGPANDALDLVERDVQLAIEEDLLQAVQGGLSIVPVAVATDRGGLEQADLVVVMQGADRHACQVCQLLDRVHACASTTL